MSRELSVHSPSPLEPTNGAQPIRVLITGFPRSGTSAIANLLARTTGCSLLDDPPSCKVASIVNQSDDWLEKRLVELEPYDLVKAPRLTEVHRKLVQHCPRLMTVHLVRDPRDVYCSALDKVKTGRITSMLSNSRFGGNDDKLYEGLAYAATHYHSVAIEAVRRVATNNFLICYDHLTMQNLSRTIASLRGVLGLPYVNDLGSDDLSRQWGPPEAKSVDRIVGSGRWRYELQVIESQRIMEIAGETYRSATELCACAECAGQRQNPGTL